jgi:hypothetical protein
MMTKQQLTIDQQIFHFIKRAITIDIQSRKVKIQSQSLFKSEEVEIDLYSLDSNVQRTRNFALFRFLFSIFITIYFFACASAWIWSPPKSVEEIAFYLFGQGVLLLGAIYSWWKFFIGSYSLTFFYNKYTNNVAFSFFNDKPDKQHYEQFIHTLKEIISKCENTRNLQSILNNIPTHILIEEFSSSYLDELVKRGIDVGSLLCFLQKRVSHQQQTIQ